MASQRKSRMPVKAKKITSPILPVLPDAGMKVEVTGLKRSEVKARNRIFIAVGLTGLMRDEWAQSRWGQVIPCNWGQVEYSQYVPQFGPQDYLVAEFRNLAVQEFLAKQFEWLFFIDNDVVLPQDFYVRMNERIIKEDIPCWSGLYFTKSVPSEPLVFRDKGGGYYAEWKMGDKVWVDAVPMGCTLIHYSLLKALWNDSEEYAVGKDIVRRVFDSPRKAWADPVTMTWKTRTGTEDLDLCWRMIEEGYFKKAGWPEYQRKKHPFLVDTSLFCGHINQDGTVFPSKGEQAYFAERHKKIKRKFPE